MGVCLLKPNPYAEKDTFGLLEGIARSVLVNALSLATMQTVGRKTRNAMPSVAAPISRAQNAILRVNQSVLRDTLSPTSDPAKPVGFRRAGNNLEKSAQRGTSVLHLVPNAKSASRNTRYDGILSTSSLSLKRPLGDTTNCDLGASSSPAPRKLASGATKIESGIESFLSFISTGEERDWQGMEACTPSKSGMLSSSGKRAYAWLADSPGSSQKITSSQFIGEGATTLQISRGFAGRATLARATV